MPNPAQCILRIARNALRYPLQSLLQVRRTIQVGLLVQTNANTVVDTDLEMPRDNKAVIPLHAVTVIEPSDIVVEPAGHFLQAVCFSSS